MISDNGKTFKAASKAIHKIAVMMLYKDAALMLAWSSYLI